MGLMQIFLKIDKFLPISINSIIYEQLITDILLLERKGMEKTKKLNLIMIVNLNAQVGHILSVLPTFVRGD